MIYTYTYGMQTVCFTCVMRAPIITIGTLARRIMPNAWPISKMHWILVNRQKETIATFVHVARLYGAISWLRIVSIDLVNHTGKSVHTNDSRHKNYCFNVQLPHIPLYTSFTIIYKIYCSFTGFVYIVMFYNRLQPWRTVITINLSNQVTQSKSFNYITNLCIQLCNKGNMDDVMFAN